MNNYKNCMTPQFNVICKELNIIFFIEFDVGYFSFFKIIYIKEFENIFRLSIHYINKLEFLKIYK